MTDDREMMKDIREAIDACTRGVDEAPTLRYRVLRKAKGEEPVKKKISTSLVIAMILVVLTATAVAATLLWKDAGEKVAPLEKENGYYDTWNTEAKTVLVRELYDLGELKDNPDAERLLKGEGLTEEEKDALCDRIMTGYVNGTPDTVTLMSILEKLHGAMETWSMEDKVWYNELLEKNDMLTAEDTHYVLPESGELGEQEAVEAARTFLNSVGAEIPDDALAEPTMTQDDEDDWYGETQISRAGERFWSVIFRYRKDGADRASHTDISADGRILEYDTSDMTRLLISGCLPDEGAISAGEAALAARKAIASALSVTEEELGVIRTYFGYISHADESEAHAPLGKRVWAVTTEKDWYALLSPAGEILYIGE